jgi:hypothetical protein
MNHPLTRAALDLAMQASDKILFIFIDDNQLNRRYNNPILLFLEQPKNINKEKE